MALWVVETFAATLNVELNVTHGIYTGSELATSRNVVYLVIDRSGSMGEMSLSGGRTPNEALVESLKLQLAAIPLGTEIHVIPFSSTIWEEIIYKSLDESARKAIVDFVTKEKPKGQTVLYDAEDLALTAAAKIMDADANAEVRVLVYTDGEHLTPWNYEGEYKACYQNKVKGFGRKRFENNPNYRSDLEAARKKFVAKFSDLIAKPNMEVEYEWLSETPKPEAEMRTKAAISTTLASYTSELLNPLEYPKQAFKGGLHLPVTDKCWEEVQGKPFAVKWTVDGKVATGTLQLKSGRQTCSIEWPSLPEDNPAPAVLAVTGLPEGRKFSLKDPKSVSYEIPALKRASVEITSPAEGAVVVAGEKVKFAAKSSENAATWSVAGERVEGLSFEKAFDKEGPVKFSVSAGKGARAASVERSIEVIKTGVELKESANGYHEVNKESSFTAAAVGRVSSYTWTVDGQEVAGGDATLKRVFDKTGTHEIGITVHYKKGITASAKRTVRVWAKPVVRIEAPEEYDGDPESAVLRAGQAIALKAVVEGAFEKTVWSFEQDGKVVATLPVAVKDGLSVGAYALPKGGLYDVKVTAEGPAGKVSEYVQIYLKAKAKSK